MRRLALILGLLGCTVVTGCYIVPDHHWHHYHGQLSGPTQSVF